MTLRPLPAADSRGRSPGLAATLEGGQDYGFRDAPVLTTPVAILTATGRRGGHAPAALAASRTAPATAPATFSLKTLGMM